MRMDLIYFDFARFISILVSDGQLRVECDENQKVFIKVRQKTVQPYNLGLQIGLTWFVENSLLNGHWSPWDVKTLKLVTPL